MILVTGGTGLVGAHLLYELAKDGKQIRAIYRPSSNLSAVKKVFSYFSADHEALFESIEWVEADITDVPSLADAFQNVDYVYHCAALISFDASKYRLHRKINIEGTANIVNLCVLNKVKKLCYTSSIAAIGIKENGLLIDEETAWDPEAKNNVYAITKYGAEIEVWRGSQEGLDVVIVNPGVIIGAGFWHDGSGQLFTTVYKGMNFYTNGSVGFVDVRDVACIMKKLMQSPIKNERYILVSENLSYWEFMTEMANSSKVPPPVKEAKPWLLQLLWKMDWLAHTLFRRKRGFYKASAISATQHTLYNNQKIIRDLNYNFSPVVASIEFVASKYIIEKDV